eukprot:1315005-Pleurochrysis_carterae.AAC.1
MHPSILAALRCMRLSVAMSDRTSLLRELGLPASAVDDDVKRAYRRVAQRSLTHRREPMLCRMFALLAFTCCGLLSACVSDIYYPDASLLACG